MNEPGKSEKPRQSPVIPPAEKPREQFDPKLEKLEEDVLEKQARSAAYRDAHERTQHLDSLNRRIDKLQTKLDLRETELQEALPRLAALEQAMKSVSASLLIGPVVMAAGGGAVSYAPMANSPYVSQDWISGAGVAGLVVGAIIAMTAFYAKRPVR